MDEQKDAWTEFDKIVSEMKPGIPVRAEHFQAAYGAINALREEVRGLRAELRQR